MHKPDRAAYARRNKGWLIPAFAALLALGALRENYFAMLGGVVGLVWVGQALRAAR